MTTASNDPAHTTGFADDRAAMEAGRAGVDVQQIASLLGIDPSQPVTLEQVDLCAATLIQRRRQVVADPATIETNEVDPLRTADQVASPDVEVAGHFAAAMQVGGRW